MIKDQQVRLNELVTEHDYNTRKMQTEYEERMKDLNDNYRTAIEELKVKNEVLILFHILQLCHFLVVNKIILSFPFRP